MQQLLHTIKTVILAHNLMHFLTNLTLCPSIFSASCVILCQDRTSGWNLHWQEFCKNKFALLLQGQGHWISCHEATVGHARSLTDRCVSDNS